MITREHVADIITTALASAHQPEDAQAFAQRLATALDALGLLQFCDIAEPDDTPQHTENPGTEFFEKRDRRDPVT